MSYEGPEDVKHPVQHTSDPKFGENDLDSFMLNYSSNKVEFGVNKVIGEELFEDWVRAEYRRRLDRRKLFPKELLGEPCWDILLDLASATLDARLISVSSACVASGVPQSTALRWLQLLEKHGFVLRWPHPDDGRRTNVAITQVGMSALRTYYTKHVSR